jgi:TolB-like protein
MNYKLFFSLIIFIFAFNNAILSQSLIPVAVLELDANGITQVEARALTDRLRYELVSIGKFEVMERDKMDNILAEQGFQKTGCVSSECMVQVGKLVGVKQIVGGSISKVGNLFTVQLRMIDVETGKILKTVVEDCECPIEDVMKKGINSASNKLVSEDKKEDKKIESPRLKPLLSSEISKIQIGIGYGKILGSISSSTSIGFNNAYTLYLDYNLLKNIKLFYQFVYLHSFNGYYRIDPDVYENSINALLYLLEIKSLQIYLGGGLTIYSYRETEIGYFESLFFPTPTQRKENKTSLGINSTLLFKYPINNSIDIFAQTRYIFGAEDFRTSFYLFTGLNYKFGK